MYLIFKKGYFEVFVFVLFYGIGGDEIVFLLIV